MSNVASKLDITRITNWMSEKVTPEELEKLLPHITALQNSLNPIMASLIDAMRASQNQTNQLHLELARIELEIIKTAMDKAETEEDKRYWAEHVANRTDKHCKSADDRKEDDHNKIMTTAKYVTVGLMLAVTVMLKRR